jgi:hypothetical protein
MQEWETTVKKAITMPVMLNVLLLTGEMNIESGL